MRMYRGLLADDGWLTVIQSVMPLSSPPFCPMRGFRPKAFGLLDVPKVLTPPRIDATVALRFRGAVMVALGIRQLVR
jgi:hypothetical protein